jgi:nitrous oxide reductase accessory protein NosL
MYERYYRAGSTLTRLIAGALIAVIPLIAAAEDTFRLPNGSNLDLSQKCPVCGMEIGGADRQGVTLTYKDGRVVGFHALAAAVFKDGSVVGFDGARCLFVYNSVPQKYNVNVSDIAHQYVTDYATKRMIELPKAYLVLGSEVKGLMGYELIPFSDKAEAGRFAAEHDGKWIVQLHEVGRAAQEGADSRERPSTSEAFRKTEEPIFLGEERPAATLQKEPRPPSPKRRSTPQRFQEPEPFFGGYGHHGGGHH